MYSLKTNELLIINQKLSVYIINNQLVIRNSI